jgi:hypothetical protein
MLSLEHILSQIELGYIFLVKGTMQQLKWISCYLLDSQPTYVYNSDEIIFSLNAPCDDYSSFIVSVSSLETSYLPDYRTSLLDPLKYTLILLNVDKDKTILKSDIKIANSLVAKETIYRYLDITLLDPLSIPEIQERYNDSRWKHKDEAIKLYSKYPTTLYRKLEGESIYIVNRNFSDLFIKSLIDPEGSSITFSKAEINNNFYRIAQPLLNGIPCSKMEYSLAASVNTSLAKNKVKYEYQYKGEKRYLITGFNSSLYKYLAPFTDVDSKFLYLSIDLFRKWALTFNVASLNKQGYLEIKPSKNAILYWNKLIDKIKRKYSISY